MKYSKNLIDTAFELECSYSKQMLKSLCQAIAAHAIVLAEKKIIPVNKQKKIFTLLKKTLVIDLNKTIKIDKENIDLYTNLDKYFTSKIGADSGWLHAGKARRESVNLSFYISIKSLLLKFENALIELALSLIDVSNKNSSIIMNDYTYLQHAQPTTLSHYLNTFIEPIKRDLTRISAVYKNLDVSPGGSGSVNGTRLPISKKRIAQLLGFESISTHSRDALWRIDLPMEIISSILIAMTNVSRLCSELIIWNSKEFSFIDLPLKFCRSSVIMPQKKNPYALSYIRGLVNSFSGRFSEFLNMGKEVSGFPDSRIFIYSVLPQDIEKAIYSIKLLGEIINEVSFKEKNFEKMLKNSPSFATDLTDLVMVKLKLDYKTSYELVKKYIKCNSLYNYENFIKFLINKSVKSEAFSKADFMKVMDPQLIIKSRNELKNNKEDIIKKKIFFLRKRKFNQLKEKKQASINKNLLSAIKKLYVNK